MNAEHESKLVAALAAHWWALVIRGLAAILLGLLAFLAPAGSLLAPVILWGAYALTDGIFALVAAARGGQRWGWLLAEGLLSIGAGVFTFARPGMTAFALLIVIAFWAWLTGVAAIAAASRLRRQIEGEWLLATSGVFSNSFGVLLLAFPKSGALALLWMVGGYAIVFGALLIGLGLRLNRWRRGGQRAFLPTGGTATPA